MSIKFPFCWSSKLRRWATLFLHFGTIILPPEDVSISLRRNVWFWLLSDRVLYVRQKDIIRSMYAITSKPVEKYVLCVYVTHLLYCHELNYSIWHLTCEVSHSSWQPRGELQSVTRMYQPFCNHPTNCDSYRSINSPNEDPKFYWSLVFALKCLLCARLT